MPSGQAEQSDQRRMEFEHARRGAGNLYFDIVHNNMENLNFEDTISILSHLTGFLDGKTKYKLDSIINSLYKSSELDPENLVAVFEELGIAPKKTMPKAVKIKARRIRRPTTAAPAPPTRKPGSKSKAAINPILKNGRTIQLNGDLEGAIYYYRHAINEGCKDLPVIKELAALYMIIGDMDHAIIYYDIALNINPDNVDLLSEKAAALIIDGQYPEAMKCHESIIKLSPDSKRGWKEKGVLQLKLGKSKRSITCFEKILEMDRNDVEALGNLALCYKELGEPRKEIEYLNRFLQLKPDDRDAWLERSEVFMHYKKYKSALKCFNSILKNDPNDFITLRKKAETLRSMGMTAEADQCLAKANSLMPVKHLHAEIIKSGTSYQRITDGLHKLSKTFRGE